MKIHLSIALCLSLLFAALVSAQNVGAVRTIPETALKAKMTVTSERVLNLNGKDYALSPGGVILNEKNMLTLTQSLPEQYVVRVKFDGQAQVQRVWILTPAEDEVEAERLGGSAIWSWLMPWR